MKILPAPVSALQSWARVTKSGLITGLLLLFCLVAPRAWTQTLDPDMQAYANRCQTPLTPDFTTAANRFVVQARAAGWWSKVKAVHFLCAPTQQAGLLNVKNTDGTLDVKSYGTVTFTPLTGMQGDGATGFLDTPTAANVVPGFTATSHSVFVFCQKANNPSLGGDLGAEGPITSVIGIRPWYQNQATVWSGTSAMTNFGVTSGLGLSGLVRNSATGGFFVKDNATAAFTQAATSTMPGSHFRYFRLGAISNYSSDQLAFGLIGDGTLTADDVASINECCVTMLTSLGTWYGLDPDLKAYLQRCAAGGDSVAKWDPQFIWSANNFILEAKSSGWWQHMASVHFLCAPTAIAAQLNVKSNIMNLTTYGGVTFTPYTGVQGDATSGYLDTDVTAGSIPGFTFSSQSMFVFSQTNIGDVSAEVGALAPNSNAVGVRVSSGSQATVWSTSTGVYVTKSVLTGHGLTGYVRGDAANVSFVKYHTDRQPADGVTVYPNAAATAWPARTIQYLRLGGSAHFSGNQLAFGFIGDGTITAAQTQDMYNSCLEMLGDDGLGTLAPDEISLPTPPNAFSRNGENNSSATVSPAGLGIFRLAAPPTSDTVSFVDKYAYGPITDCVTRPWGSSATSTDTQVGRWELIWSDRSNVTGLTKGNDTMGVIYYDAPNNKVQARTVFDSYQKAIGSTLVKTAYSAGYKFWNEPADPQGKGWGQIAQDYGFNVAPWIAKWTANPNDPIFTKDVDTGEDMGDIVHHAYCAAPSRVQAFFPTVSGPYRVSTNKVILGVGREADVPTARGFVLDHEHADKRGGTLEQQYMLALAAIVHAKGFQLGVSTEAVNSGTGELSGWTIDNANPILNAVDWIVMIAGPDPVGGNQTSDLTAQWNFFAGPNGTLPVNAAHLCLQLTVGPSGNSMSLSDAAEVRQFVINHSIPRCIVPNSYAVFGGALSRPPNQVLATFLGMPTQ